jgi:hypothetical protein
MTKKEAYSQESAPELFNKLWLLRDNLFEIISLESEVKKLKEHPIKDWYQWTADIYSELVNDAFLMMGHKEVSELFEDFKNSKNSKLKKLVIATKTISDEVVKRYVDEEYKESYLNSHLSTAKNIGRNELKNIRFMKDFR